MLNGTRVQIDVQPRPEFRREIQHLILSPTEHDAVQLERQFFDVAGAVCDQSVFSLISFAVTLRETQKTLAKRVFDELE